MMEGKERRNQIIELLSQSDKPISGTEIAEKLGVSRQVIVQDIALLRATNKNILSTNKGYVLFGGKTKATRTFHVSHSDEGMEAELLAIVENGGKILDVVVEHEIYGQITVDLIIQTRRDVREFMEKITASDDVKPLKLLTNDEHYHTVEADREEDLDEIGRVLKEKGFLL